MPAHIHDQQIDRIETDRGLVEMCRHVFRGCFLGVSSQQTKVPISNKNLRNKNLNFPI